ncbi:hypothetical protein [Anaerococcus sp.]|uniref:hypothetical protein n=1 Tax=Anaerococcus sp. TaxID=1872515 RepID=UPI0029038CDD|nr:hypothetical protein [Anaerococcus sp.]MDU3212353.1 hypothetical protein [Anaerococcus sp.]
MKYLSHIAKKCKDWVRLEAEFSSDYAHQLTELFKDCKDDEELKNIILSIILDRYMFFYTGSGKPTKLTRLMLQELDNKNFELESLSPRNNSLERSIDHLIKGSGLFSTMYKIYMIWGEDELNEFLEFLYERFKEYEPNNDVFIWLNKNKESYKIQGVPWEYVDEKEPTDNPSKDKQ